jgi:futalosine hydrolase
MSVCIVAATSHELQPLLPFVAKEQYHFLITGVGSAATTYHLTQTLHHKKPSLFIQAGIAGCFDGNIPLAQAVIIQQDRFADLGVVEDSQWKDVFDMNLASENDPPYTNGWLVNPHQDLLRSLQLPLVKSITINEVTTHPERIKQLREKYNPTIESMEGAAFHYVCLQENIPFIQLRTISNYAGERNKEKWQLKQAIDSLAEHIMQITRQLRP